MKKDTLKLALKYIILLLTSVLMLFPLFWMISTSLKSGPEVFKIPLQWIPENLLWDNFTALFSKYNAGIYLKNTIILCILNVAGSLISCSLVAYGLTFIEFKHKNIMLMLMLMTMMIPGAVTFFPQFLVYVKLGWYGTNLPLWFPAFTANAYFVILLRQYFLSIPKPIIDAAKISGCGHFKMMTKIVLPLAKPVLIMIAISAFTFAWTDLFGPLVYLLNENDKTWSLLLTYLNNSWSNESSLPKIMAAGLISMIPTLIIYFLAQKEMIKSFVFKKEE